MTDGSTEPARDLHPLIRPRSVAVVGASDDASSIGGAPIANLNRFGFTGPIHLVSRSRATIDGRATVPTVAELPDGIDTAVLAVPGAVAADVLGQCGQRGIRSAIVYSSGFAEVGGAGIEAQNDLIEVACRYEMAVAGPNCLGLVNFVDRIPLTFAAVEPDDVRGRAAIGLVAQSGAMTIGLTYAAQAAGLAVSYAMSTGNEAVIGLEDYVEFLIADPHTSIVGLLAEQIRHPRRLRRLVGRAREAGKPIVLLQLGRSRGGRAAASTHTGALAGDYDQLAAVLRGDGVLVVDSLDEITDVAHALARHRTPPRSPAAALITDSGAVKTLSLDQAETLGLTLAELSPPTITRLRSEMPPFATATNPADITAQGLNDPSLYGKAVAALLADDAVGMLTVATMIGSDVQTLDQVQAVVRSVEGSDKPVWYVLLGGERAIPAPARDLIREAGLPLLRSTQRALQAMKHVGDWARSERDRERLSVPPSVDEAGPVEPTLTTMSEKASKDLLASIDIAVPIGELVSTVDEGGAAGDRLGYPVAVKAQVRGVVHKTELGAVALDLRSAATLRLAMDSMLERIGAERLEGFLIERMAEPGVELIVGAQRDPQWGVTVLVGLGGTLAEVLRDRTLLPARFDQATAVDAIRSLRGAALFEPFRGRPALDVAAAARVLVAVSELMRSDATVVELDVNPLRVSEGGATALDATVICVDRPAGGQ